MKDHLFSNPCHLKICIKILLSAALVISMSFHGERNDPKPLDLGNSLMPVGAYYYPEHWPEEEWERDLKKMAELGFQFTHIGEFAWSRMEPEEGRYDFSWVDRVLELAGQYGLKVILCTPTPTPPAWLTHKHPEILAVNESLVRQQHGGRLHAIYDHPIYLRYVEKIITLLGERYGDHPSVVGWQLDNEPHFGPIYDYSEFAVARFPVWLQKKYRTIDELNRSWGTSFWSQTYNTFEQIPLPNKNTKAHAGNPHAWLDFARFTADRLAGALRFQAELLRKTISEDQWITTNYAYYKFLPATDPFLNKNDLDFASHTMYLTSGHLNDEGGSLAFRLGSGLELSFSNELARSVNGYTGIMELQPGQINWGRINPQPLPGAVRMWGWHAFALGDRFLCTYRFRQPLFGAEQTHKGIIETDGVSLSRGGEEYRQLIGEIDSLSRLKVEKRIPERYSSRKTAFLWNPDNLIDIGNHRHHADFDPWQHIYSYYAHLKSMGCAVTFVREQEDLNPDQYPFMVVAAYQLMSRELIAKLRQYVQQGGHLIMSCRSGKKDPNGHLWKARNQEPIWELIGASIPEFDHLPAAYPGMVESNGEQYKWYQWGDWLEPFKGTKILARYADQFYKGAAAVVSRQLGRGSVTYIGVYTRDGKLEKKIINDTYRQAGRVVEELPPYVFLEWRDGFWIMVNYSSRAYEYPLDEKANVLIGDPLLKPGGVIVWN